MRVSGLTGVTAISAGWRHTVALASDGTVWAWGDNTAGDLGDGTTTERLTPVQVSGLTGITAISAGFWHTVALKSDGTVWAWGYNYYGQLGDGTTTERLTPVQVSGLMGVTAISAGNWHTVAIKSDSTVCAWGYNASGELGDGGGESYSAIPVQVLGLTAVTAIAGGGLRTMALTSDSTVWAWGDNDYGQLGDGDSTGMAQYSPVQVSGLSGITAISAGWYHTVALASDGTVRAWGYNKYGQLGNGDSTGVAQYGPVQVSGLSGVKAIAAGGRHSVALKNDSTVWACGYNHYGEIGDGTTTNRLTPVQVVFDLTPPVGTVSINGGAAYTNSASVTLTLPATDDSGTVARMWICNDGAFDIGTWQPYSASTTWTLSPGDGLKTVYVEFMDPSGNISNVATASITLDAVPPAISSVTIIPPMAAIGDTVTVTVSASDNTGTVSVTANGAALAQDTSGNWWGQLQASGPNGVQTVAVIAYDHCNSTDSSATYSVVPVVGAAVGSCFDPIASIVCSSYIFKCWGTVTTIDSNSFWLDDGSSRGPIEVIAPGYTGIADNNYASARGILNPTASPVTLTCPAGKVTKLN